MTPHHHSPPPPPPPSSHSLPPYRPLSIHHVIDIGVAAVYPQLRFLENVCVRAGVRVPLALVREGKPTLDDTYTVIL